MRTDRMTNKCADPQSRHDGLAGRFRAKKASLGVIGLGYVGLPLSLAAANSGLEVLGFDTDRAKPEMLANGSSYLRHIPSEAIAATVV